MSILRQPFSEYSVDALAQAARAAGDWYKKLPATTWALSGIFRNAKWRINLRDFSQDNRELVRSQSNTILKQELLARFNDRDWSLAIIHGQIYGLYTTYEALLWLLYEYDSFLFEIEENVKLANSTGTGEWSWREFEDVSAELTVINGQMIKAYGDIAATLPKFLVSPPPNYLNLIPTVYADLFLTLQKYFTSLVTTMTGLVKDYEYQKALADQEQAQLELNESLRLLAQQEAANEARRQTDLANAQLEAARLAASLSGAALAQETADRARYLDWVKNERYNWSYDTVKDSASYYDIARWAGITRAEVDAAFGTPESRMAMETKLNDAATQLVSTLTSGGATDWQPTENGYVYLGDDDEDENTVTVLGSKFKTSTLVIGTVGAAIIAALVLKKK